MKMLQKEGGKHSPWRDQRRPRPHRWCHSASQMSHRDGQTHRPLPAQLDTSWMQRLAPSMLRHHTQRDQQDSCMRARAVECHT